jgi:hypothetical protein
LRSGLGWSQDVGVICRQVRDVPLVKVKIAEHRVHVQFAVEAAEEPFDVSRLL